MVSNNDVLTILYLPWLPPFALKYAYPHLLGTYLFQVETCLNNKKGNLQSD